VTSRTPKIQVYESGVTKSIFEAINRHQRCYKGHGSASTNLSYYLSTISLKGGNNISSSLIPVKWKVTFHCAFLSRIQSAVFIVFWRVKEVHHFTSRHQRSHLYNRNFYTYISFLYAWSLHNTRNGAYLLRLFISM